MFEFHGWATLRVDDTDDADISELRRRENEAQALLTEAIVRYEVGCIFEVRTTCNDLRVLNVHGLRNHKCPGVIELFRWVADNLPFAYGLLYVWDDEGEFHNSFRVWRLARGVLTEESDPFLSPCIPVIEPPWSEPESV